MLWQNMAGRPSLFARWLGGLTRREKNPRTEILYPSPVEVQSDQIAALGRQVEAEKYRNAQLILLNELSQQLETRWINRWRPNWPRILSNAQWIVPMYVCSSTNRNDGSLLQFASAGKMARINSARIPTTCNAGDDRTGHSPAKNANFQRHTTGSRFFRLGQRKKFVVGGCSDYSQWLY